ncbi:MAG: restriction endonuclease subunit S [Planctomycetes bacterium]|nr:restriction endonuclease subunit S [Planctomycetota bacterium]
MKWPIFQLQQIATDLQPGFARQPSLEGDGVAHLRTNNVSKDGHLDLSSIKNVVPSEGERKTYSLLPGDILFNNTNSPALVGKSALFTTEGEYLFSNHMTRIRVSDKLAHSRFIARCLHWVWKTGRFRTMVTQWVNQAAINRSQVARLTLGLPALSEQRRIVEILDQADALRKKRAEADAKAARILPALFYKMFGDPATNSKGWPTKRLSDPQVATINPRFSGHNVSADTELSFVPMADVDEIWGRIVGSQVRTYSDVMRGFTPFQDDDVLFAKITPCMQNGKAAIARNLVNGRGFGSTEFHVLRAGPIATPEWLYILVRLAWFRRQAESSFTGTAGQQRVPADFLARYEIGCPPIDLQRKFAKAVVQIQEWVHQKDRSRQGVEALFAVLLHRAFTGDLTAKWREAHMKKLLAEMEVQARMLESER